MDTKQIVILSIYTISIILITVLIYKIIKRPKNKLIESAEKKTAEELDLNNRIFLHMTDGIIAFDMQGKMILINPAAKKLLSISRRYNLFRCIWKIWTR